MLYPNPSYLRRFGALPCLLLGVLLGGLSGAPAASALDLCGCDGHPQSLGAFDLNDSSTWPVGTTRYCHRYNEDNVWIPLPADGVLIFDSFDATGIQSGCWASRPVIGFVRNGSNSPVTLLIAGNVTIGSGVELASRGAKASNGTSAQPGRGGNPGNGGYRGGDGAYFDSNGANTGGDGLGPSGGAGGTGTPLLIGGNGAFPGRPELRPLIGGGGGGGGGSAASGNCSGGGGGGGGGAILIAANGTVTVNGTINADGGAAGSTSDGSCASAGGGGSGGAIRIVAGHVSGSGALYARGASGAGAGIVRVEPLDGLSDGIGADPVARRPGSVSPLSNPLASSVAITTIDGQPVPASLLGPTGGTDLLLSAPGTITFELASTGVPVGTEIVLSIKPRVGGTPIEASAVVDANDCDIAGNCNSLIQANLDTGAYFVLTHATFQVP